MLPMYIRNNKGHRIDRWNPSISHCATRILLHSKLHVACDLEKTNNFWTSLRLRSYLQRRFFLVYIIANHGKLVRMLWLRQENLDVHPNPSPWEVYFMYYNISRVFKKESCKEFWQGVSFNVRYLVPWSLVLLIGIYFNNWVKSIGENGMTFNVNLALGWSSRKANPGGGAFIVEI